MIKQVYTLEGMTCNGCVASVKNALVGVEGVTTVEVSLAKKEVILDMNKHISKESLMAVLPKKFSIIENRNKEVEYHTDVSEKSKLQQLKPLGLIFLYLLAAAILLSYKEWDTAKVMLDFMGLFYIVFSFFKLLDLKGFSKSFAMYDPLAHALPVYGWVYPFIELGLGLMFLMRYKIAIALIATVLVLGITTVGVTKSLFRKKNIQCACLGTALKLPMTEATFIENAIMLLMAFWMLFVA